MCGISGLIHRDGHPINHALLQTVTDTLVHRGPDASGTFVDGALGLGHRRLSVIDLEGGAQPMSTSSSEATIVFNGEIYNFQDLKLELQKKGYTFQTNSDTEVLLYMWQEKGPEFLHDIWGMFSLAIYDKKKNIVFMAVDRFGQKPFYYHASKDLFAFASEPKALTCIPEVSTELEPSSLHHYLSFLAVAPPKSIYKHIHRLAGGRQLIYDLNNNTLEESMWYHLNALEKSDLSFDEAKEKLRDLVKDATKRRLMSDVPLGCFLSGGIDSAIVSGLANGMTIEPLKTFTIANSEATWDESPDAKRVAEHFHTDHHVRSIEPCQPDKFVSMIEHIGEPFADSSLLPTNMVCSFAREQVTVALSGDGADEAFSGYDRYRAMALASYLDFIPQSLRKKLLNILGFFLPAPQQERTLMHKAHRFLKMAAENDLNRYFVVHSHFTEEDKHNLYSDHFSELVAPYNSVNIMETDFARSHGAESLIDRIIDLDIQRYLQDDILVKADRASMQASLELRSPFLDHRVIEFASSLPYSYKRQGSNGKHILKEAFKDFLPEGHTTLRKKGFAVPLGQWFRGPMKEMALDFLTDQTAKERDIFNPASVSHLLDEHFKLKADHGQKIWALCAFEVWARSL